MNIIRYELLRKFRNKIVLFWMFVFPLILMTMYTVVVKPAYEYELNTIQIRIIEDKKDAYFDMFIKQLQKEELFEISYTSYKEASTLLNQSKIHAIVEVLTDGTLQITCKENGIEESVIASVMNTYEKQKAMVQQWQKDGKTQEEIQALFYTDIGILKNLWSKQDTMILYVLYFSTMAISCMYCGHYGIRSMRDLQANQSVKARRLQICPMKKSHLVWIQLITNILVCILCNILQLWVLMNIFGVMFQTHIIYVYCTTILGSLIGLGIGMVIGTIHILKMEWKINILSFVSMFLCMLSGMTNPTFKYFIHQHFPFLEFINPCALLTDAYLRLSLYGVDEVYQKDMIVLVIVMLICYGITFKMIRRQQYASL